MTVKRFAAENGNEKLKFSPAALRAMEQYHWPGNIRELENRVRRAAIMAEGSRITDADLELTSSSAPLGGVTLKEAREALEKEYLERALQRHKGKPLRRGRRTRHLPPNHLRTHGQIRLPQSRTGVAYCYVHRSREWRRSIRTGVVATTLLQAKLE